MKNFMHVFLFRRFLMPCLTVLLAVLTTVPASSQVTMEVTDVYGDTQQLPLSGNMTIYAPQSNYSWAHLVMCDAAGTPVWSMPISQLSSIRYLGAPVSTATPELPDESKESPYFTWQIQGKDYRVVWPGEWHLSADLSMLTLRMADGKSYRIPLSATGAIQIHEQVGLAHYFQKWAKDAQIYNWAFWNGAGGSQDKLFMHFYAYVPEHRQLHCSLLVPDDEALAQWIDVVSLASQKPRMLNLKYSARSGFPINFSKVGYLYDAETGTIGRFYNLEMASEADISNRLGIMLQSHLIIHRPEDGTLGLLSGNEYFQAMDGSIVRAVVENGQLKAVQGTFQLWNQARGITKMQLDESVEYPEEFAAAFKPLSLDRCNIKEQCMLDGGWIYRIDSPMEATPLSAYAVLSADETDANPFRRFLELCMPKGDIIGFLFPTLKGDSKKSMEKLMIPFIPLGGNDYNLSYVSGQSFTLYVPTNKAIEQEIETGRLFTWEDIEADISSCTPEGGEVSEMDRQRISQKVETVLNFIRAHVQFGVEIADQLPFERAHNTALVLPKTLRTPQLKVKSTGKGQLSVTDELGHTRNVLDAHKNIFVRDMVCTRGGIEKSPKNQTTMNGITLNEYATGVIHQIDGVLSYKAE